MATKISRTLRRAELNFVALGIVLSILAAVIIFLVDGCTLLSREVCRLSGVYEWAYAGYATLAAIFCFYSVVTARVVVVRILFALQGVSFASFAASRWMLDWLESSGFSKLMAGFRICTAVTFVLAAVIAERKVKRHV